MMRCHIILVAFLLCILNTKKSFALSIPNDQIREADIIETILKEYDGRFSISEIWKTIKNGLNAAWESIVNAGKETIEKIKIWIFELRLKTDEILQMIKQRLNEMREDIKIQLEEIAKKSQEMAELVRKCYQPHEQQMEDIITDALDQIRKCMFTTNKAMSELEGTVSNSVNEEMFIENLKSKLDSCASDEENLDQCLTNVNDYINYQIRLRNIIVWKEQNDAKNIIDDILDKLLICSTEGVTKASEKLSEKVIDIGKCVKKEIDQKDKDNIVMN